MADTPRVKRGLKDRSVHVYATLIGLVVAYCLFSKFGLALHAASSQGCKGL